MRSRSPLLVVKSTAGVRPRKFCPASAGLKSLAFGPSITGRPRADLAADFGLPLSLTLTAGFGPTRSCLRRQTGGLVVYAPSRVSAMVRTSTSVVRPDPL